MARNYPRFVFSDPKNDKGEGPFIVHCLYPRMVLKITKTPEGKLYLVPLYGKPDATEEPRLLKDAIYWLIGQIKQRQIVISDISDVLTVPKFLFANPQNIKKPGPIVIHCQTPDLIMTVLKEGSEWVCKTAGIYLDEEVQEPIELAATLWLNNQIKTGKILL